MNPDKLKQLQMQAAAVRIGGKGTPRRKKKVVHRTATTDDKKLQSCLKKVGVNTIPGIEEVNMMREDGSVLNFNNPRVQASLPSNTFAVTGHAETKQIAEMLPGILNQLGTDSLNHLRRLATAADPAINGGDGDNDADDDDVPDLVDNFDDFSVNEAPVASIIEIAKSESEVIAEEVPPTKVHDVEVSVKEVSAAKVTAAGVSDNKIEDSKPVIGEEWMIDDVGTLESSDEEDITEKTNDPIAKELNSSLIKDSTEVSANEVPGNKKEDSKPDIGEEWMIDDVGTLESSDEEDITEKTNVPIAKELNKPALKDNNKEDSTEVPVKEVPDNKKEDSKPFIGEEWMIDDVGTLESSDEEDQ